MKKAMSLKISTWLAFATLTTHVFVIPAQAGNPSYLLRSTAILALRLMYGLDSRLRGNDVDGHALLKCITQQKF